MTATSKLMTADELLALPDDGCRHELLDGVLTTMAPTSGSHGGVEVKFARHLDEHVEELGLGEVWTGEPGIFLRRHPDRVRAPDVCFFTNERLARVNRSHFSEVVPNLIVEVVSPGDTATAVQQKVLEWLDAGAELVWCAYPSLRQVVAYRSASDIRTYREGDLLDGVPVLPDFSIPVDKLFRSVPRSSEKRPQP